MLENLSTIDWCNLGGWQDRPVGDVPKMIRALASPDPEEWVVALDLLYTWLCRSEYGWARNSTRWDPGCMEQWAGAGGDYWVKVTEVAPHAVPFLIELLGYDEVRCRGRILQFLGDAARAANYHNRRKTTASANMDEWERQMGTALWNGLDVYFKLLADPDKRLRISAPVTLALLVGYASEQVPEAISRRGPFLMIAEALQRQLEQESNELVKASLLLALHYLTPYDPQVVCVFKGCLNDARASKLVKLSAALCLAAARQELPSAALQVMLDALLNTAAYRVDSGVPPMEAKHHYLAERHYYFGHIHPGQTHHDEGGYDPDDVGKSEDFTFPWCRGLSGMSLKLLQPYSHEPDCDWSAWCWPLFMIEQGVARRDADFLKVVVPSLLYRLDSSRAEPLPVLRLVFGDQKVNPSTQRTDLTWAQAEVVQHIYDNPFCWVAQPDILQTWFSEFGLPLDREAWARLLEVQDKPPTFDQRQALFDILQKQQQVPTERMYPDFEDYERPEFCYVKVKRIDLRPLGAVFLPHLQGNTEVEEMDMSGLGIKDADLIHLMGFPYLKTLHLAHTAITDAAAEWLSKCQGLEHLDVSNTSITDTGLQALQSLPRLRTLQVGGLTLTAQTVEQFLKANPACTICR